MYWTIQHNSILESVLERGVYEPDFALSPVSEAMKGSYFFILNYFNTLNLNLEKHNGLIFCFDDTPERRLNNIDDVRAFLSSGMRRRFIYKAGINDDMFDCDEYSVFALDKYPEGLYTLPIDTSYFVALSDYLNDEGMISRDSPAKELVIKLGNSWVNGDRFLGWMLPSTVNGMFSSPSNIMQYHLPYISNKNLVYSVPLCKVVE